MKKQNFLPIIIIAIIVIMVSIKTETKHQYPFLTSLSAGMIGAIIVGEYIISEQDRAKNKT